MKIAILGAGNVGGDDRILLLKQIALAWANLAIFQKEGRNIAFKVMKR